MQANQKTTTISGATIENMEIGDDIKITISHGNDAYNGKTYAVSSDVVVKKNTSTVDLSSIYKGDKGYTYIEVRCNHTNQRNFKHKRLLKVQFSHLIATKSIMVVKVDNKEQTYMKSRAVYKFL